MMEADCQVEAHNTGAYMCSKKKKWGVAVQVILARYKVFPDQYPPNDKGNLEVKLWWAI